MYKIYFVLISLLWFQHDSVQRGYSVELSQNDILNALKIHNKARIEFGVNEIEWSDDLSDQAQEWANNLAKKDKIYHSSSESRVNQGENLYYSFRSQNRKPVFSKSPAKDASLAWYNEINDYIAENEENLKEAYIDFSYAKIEPSNLIEINEFNEDFYKKIDEIENDILNEVSLEDIAKKNEITLQKRNNFKFLNEDGVFKEIYENKDKKEIVLKDKDNYFLIYQITKINNLLPNKNDESFKDKVKNRILLKKKFDLNKNLFEKIQNKDFNDSDFENLVKNKENINSGIINSINDFSLFDETSLKLIYELPKNSFVMVSNRANNIFLAKINQITYENLKSTNENIQEYLAKTNINLIDDIYSSYDTSLNTKYEVKIFNNNIDRIKDYFK